MVSPYPPIPHHDLFANITGDIPEQAPKDIQAAMMLIPEFLSDEDLTRRERSKTAGIPDQRSIELDKMLNELQKRGIRKAVSRWAIRLLCECGAMDRFQYSKSGTDADLIEFVESTPKLWEWLRAGRPFGNASGQGEPELDYVDLDQIAATVNCSKSTLEKRKNRRANPLPLPEVEGGGGRKSLWLWHKVKPWLEHEFGRKFNDTLPRRP